MADARHGWRKNAKDNSVAIGEKTHKVLCEHVTKTNDTVTQRHGRFGTEKYISTFENLICSSSYPSISSLERNAILKVRMTPGMQ